MVQGYIVYSVKQKLKQEYVGLPGDEIKELKLSGVEVCHDIIVEQKFIRLHLFLKAGLNSNPRGLGF